MSGRSAFNIVERGQALLGESMFKKPPPTRTHCGAGVRATCSAKHVASLSASERKAVPAQFEVVVDATSNDVEIRIDQAWNDAPTAGVNDVSLRTGQWHAFAFVADGNEPSVSDGKRRRLRRRGSTVPMRAS